MAWLFVERDKKAPKLEPRACGIFDAPELEFPAVTEAVKAKVIVATAPMEPTFENRVRKIKFHFRYSAGISATGFFRFTAGIGVQPVRIKRRARAGRVPFLLGFGVP